MTDWQPLSKSRHAALHYRPRGDYAHARERPLVPVLLGELAQLIPYYLIAFQQQGDSYHPRVVLAAPDRPSLYLRPDGQWDAPYVPAALRGYPFALLPGRDADSPVLAVDGASLCTSAHGEPLFDARGELGDGVQQSCDFLVQLERQRQRTEAATGRLQAAGVIQPWLLKLPVEGDSLSIGGLYRIDEQALNGLAPDVWASLQGAPAQLAYAQLYSMARLEALTWRANRQSSAPGAGRGEAAETLFHPDDDDITFDFDS